MRWVWTGLLILMLGCAPKDCPCGGCGGELHPAKPGRCSVCPRTTGSFMDAVCPVCATSKKLCEHCGSPMPK